MPTTRESPQFTPAFAGYAEAVRARFERLGLLKMLGARLVSLAPGQCVIEAPSAEALSQTPEGLDAAAIAAIGQAAASLAAGTLMPQGAQFVLAEYKINLVRPARRPLARALGQVIRSGRTVTVCRAEVMSIDGESEAPELCAILQATVLRLDPKA